MYCIPMSRMNSDSNKVAPINSQVLLAEMGNSMR